MLGSRYLGEPPYHQYHCCYDPPTPAWRGVRTVKPLEPLATRFVPPRLPGLPGLPGAPRGCRVSHHFERGVFRICKAPSGVWRVLEGVSGASRVYRGLEGSGRVFRSSRVLEGYPRFSRVQETPLFQTVLAACVGFLQGGLRLPGAVPGASRGLQGFPGRARRVGSHVDGAK